MKARALMSVVAVFATVVTVASQSPAATLNEVVWHILGSSTAPTSDTSHDISVHSAYGGYRGQGNVGGASVVVKESFGGATILDYGFYKANTSLPGLVEAYASGTNGLISLPIATGQGGNESHANVWTTNDPGGYDFPNPANFTTATVLKTASCTATINISSQNQGRVYFFYGGYRGWVRYDLTMSGASPTNIQATVGRNDYSDNNEMYVVGVDFSHTGEFDTIEYTFVREDGNNGRGRHIGVVLVTPATDTNAPSQVTWESAPAPVNESSITMTAAEAIDPEGAPVAYLFQNLTLGTDSGWQFDRTYTEEGLSASSNYTYTVTARDQSPNQNMTLPSAPASATTLTPDTTPPPTPSFAVPPTPLFPNEPYEITMTASVVNDPETNGVEYFFTCTSGGGNDSGWQDSTNYTDTGLTPETTYEYTVKARDKSIGQNESAPSAPVSTTTLKVPTATMTENPAWFLFSGSPFNVSVYPDNAGFRCPGQAISEVISGTIQAYAFIKESSTNNVIQVYASSEDDLLSFGDYEPRSNQNLGSGNNLDNLWTVSDPGVDWTNPADHTSGTTCGPFNFLEGSIDVSGFAAGTVHFFYGGYRTRQYFDLTIKDTDGTETALPLLNVGDNDFSNGSEWYSASIDFDNPTGYDTIDWLFSSSLYNALGANVPHCSFAGLVLVAEGVTKEGTVLMVR